MLACRKGFLQIVYVLHDCPYLDVNLQDNEGNTALMIASQAGVYVKKLFLFILFILYLGEVPLRY